MGNINENKFIKSVFLSKSNVIRLTFESVSKVGEYHWKQIKEVTWCYTIVYWNISADSSLSLSVDNASCVTDGVVKSCQLFYLGDLI